MKTKGIKILTAVLIIVMAMSLTTAVLAEGTGGGQKKPADERGRKLEMLYADYAPDLLDDYLAVKQEHQAFHTERKTMHERFRQQIRTELTSIIDSFADGEMTGEEAKKAIIEIRENLKALKADLSAIREEKHAENEALKAQRESLRLQIQAALQAEEVDEALMYSLLEQSLEQFRQHLALDYCYADKTDAAIAEHFPQ